MLDKFAQDNTSEWIEFQKDFEKKKRQYAPNMDDMDLNFPVELVPMFKQAKKYDLQERLLERDFKKSVELVKHSLILKPALMEKLFEPAIQEITQHIEELMRKKELRSVSTLLLVGGFSESPTVSGALRKHFGNVRVIAPGNGSVAILKGAVMFGNDANVIAARVSPYTYGVHTRKYFNPASHPADRKRIIRGAAVIDNVFDKHIECGEHVYVGGKSRERKYVVYNRNNPYVYWNVYHSENKNPLFCDEPGSLYLGKLEIKIPEDLKEDRVTLMLSMTCRGTELEATAVATDSDIQCAARFDFLEDDISRASVDVFESIN